MDAAERTEILRRYGHHRRRFAAAGAAAAAKAGTAEVIPPGRNVAEAETPLTTRELEVLRLVADGHTNEEIAQRLHLARETVKSHVRNLLAKLQVGSRAHAVAVAFRR